MSTAKGALERSFRERLAPGRGAPALGAARSLDVVHAEHGVDFRRARARAGFSRGHLIDVVLALPGGPFWVGLIGVAIIGYGVSQIYLAWNEKHQKKLATEGKAGEAGKAYLLFGKVGYIAKGIAIGLVGVLFVYAAFTQDPDKSGSTDKALHTVLQQPFGPYLLMALAAGIACYGLFNFARARHLAK